MIFKCNIPTKKCVLALSLSLIAVPFSRLISPRAIIDGNDIYLAWLPLSVMLSMILLFGRHAVLPLIVAFALADEWMLNLSGLQVSALLFCQLFSVFLSCAILRYTLGKRWRYGLPGRHMGIRIFWAYFFAPLVLKATMYMVGYFLDFPLSISSYFGSGSMIYNIIDIQSLISAALIFTILFYYPLRMIVNPNFARKFWRYNILPAFCRKQRLFTLNWMLALCIILLVLCSPYQSPLTAGYLVPLIFILFFFGISRFRYQLLSVLWAVSALLLVVYNKNFLQGVSSEYSLSFVLSVFISFTICMLYMSQIYSRSNVLRRKWHNQAMEDPLTGLPNLRALECYLMRYPEVRVCCLRMDNLEFLSRHYGMMMRVHCKRMITQDLQPLLYKNEQLFQLPGSELLLVLHGEATADRLRVMVDFLNGRKYHWHNNELALAFGASWGAIQGEGEALHHTLGQLSWLSEQACVTRQVLALDCSLDTVSDNTTERVYQLNRVRRALEQGELHLYAQPIVSERGDIYHEILTRLTCNGELITPDLFIPVIAQFNLSKRFDMQVVETLFRAMAALPDERFSVNLMPFTLMQNESANEIIALFHRYRISPQSIILEITEEQAFSDSEVSLLNIQRLRDFGCQVAIDDFGTGYANFERLKRLQADIVKIDGCFVRDIVSDSMDAMIVKSICELARVKNLTLVAEFVETDAQRALLYQLGVDYLQGYLIGKPRPLTELQK